MSEKCRGGKEPFGDDEFSSPILFLEGGYYFVSTKNDENTLEK